MDTHEAIRCTNPELAKEMHKSWKRDCRISRKKFLDGEISGIGESVRVWLLHYSTHALQQTTTDLTAVDGKCLSSGLCQNDYCCYALLWLQVRGWGSSMQRRINSDSTAAIASDIATMLVTMGVDRIVTVDLQPPGQADIEGFFTNRTPVDCIEATYTGVEYFRQKVSKDAVIVSANPTCTKKARDFQSGLLGSGYRWKDGKLEKMDVSTALFIPETAGDGCSEEEDNDIGMVDVLYLMPSEHDSASGVDDGNKPKLLRRNLVWLATWGVKT